MAKDKWKRNRLQRPIGHLFEALIGHLQLLEEYSHRAFEKGEWRFVGEVAAKLRLLACEGGRNRALLLSLMDHFDSKTVARSRFPMQGEPEFRTLREYMTQHALLVAKRSGGKAIYNNAQLVKAVAEQDGAAHEDWEHDEDLLAAKGGGMMIGGFPPHVACLRVISRTVLSVADRFVQELQERGLVTQAPKPESGAASSAEGTKGTEPNQ